MVPPNVVIEYDQWPFQQPKLEVPTVHEAYVRPMYRDIPPKCGHYGTVPPFWDP